MPKPTWGQIQKDRDRNVFVGRQSELALFEQNFLDPEAPAYLIFSIHGQGGIGKSTLIKRYRAIAAEKKAHTALTNEAEFAATPAETILNAMARLVDDLCDAKADFSTFNERYKKYRECIQTIEADETAPRGVFDILGRTTMRGIVALAKTTPPGQIVNTVIPDLAPALEEQAGVWAEFVARKFKNKDEVALVRDPVGTLTPLFLAELNDHAEKHLTILCFDTWECTGPHLQPWLLNILNRGELTAGVWLIIAGRNPLAADWQDYHDLIASCPLSEFTPEEARDYLSRVNITAEPRIQQILEFSGGSPALVAMLASAKGGSDSDYADDLVDRYLKWVDDPQYRQAALTGAFARRINKDILAALTSTEQAAALFEWLIAQPFLQSRPDYWEYHPKVRTLMLDYVTRRSPQDALATHVKLQAHYQQQAAARDIPDPYRDRQWRAHTLESLYHGLLQEKQASVQAALEVFLLSLRSYSIFVLEILIAWQQATAECSHSDMLAHWLNLLEGALKAIISDKDWEIALPFCKAALALDALSSRARSEVHFIAGLTYYNLLQYDMALTNHDRAIDLNPQDARMYNNRGLTYHEMKQYEAALADYGRAIELNPQDADAYFNRGLTYHEMKLYDAAQTDFTHTLELSPQDADAHLNRGLTYHEMKQYNAALVDYGKAIELNPQDAKAYHNRGITYANLQDYAAALADFIHVIELDPQDATAYYNRGLTYHEIQQYDPALADFGKAIELNPQDADAYSNRGFTYHKMKQYDAALADYEKAIELDPQHASAHYNAACVHALKDHVTEACAWLGKAIALDEQYRQIVHTDTDFDPIRNEPCFQSLVGPGEPPNE